MKENKYDDEKFFQKYAEMSRSKEGLQGAGEWPTLQTLLPDFKNKRMLDLGCGYGWHCRYAIEAGASEVIGVDLSQKMLERARSLNDDRAITYEQKAIEDARYEPESFDIVFSSLAFHYVKDYAQVVQQIYQMLKPGGCFLFSVEHPDFTAEGSQDWYYDENGKILHFPLDHYYEEGKRTAIFLGEEVVKYHRTLTTYVDTLLQCGFRLERLVEPAPTPQAIAQIPGMKDELRRPMMLIIKACK